MIRRLFSLASLLSLLLCVATVVLWVRSYTRADHLVICHGSENWCYLCTVRGEARIVAEPMWTSWNGRRLFSLSSDQVGYLSMKSYRSSVTIPLWLIVVVIVCRTIWRHRMRRVDPMLFCRNCSYDLTGNTSGVCPECGAAVTAAPAKTQATMA